MRIIRDPTLQFIVILLVAPLCAMLGTSLHSAANPFSAPLAGWLATLSLWSFFAIRSVRHLRQTTRPPRSPVELRLLVGIAFFAVIVTAAAVIVAALLVAGMV